MEPRITPAEVLPASAAISLNNLRAIYEGRRDIRNLRWVMALRAALPPPYADRPGEFDRSMAPLN